MRIAFYAPLKEPDHPVPSGDRQMARLLIAALRAGGHTVELASRLRSFLPNPDATRQAAVEHAAALEAEILASRWSTEAAGPDLWFTYHPFYKAPDFLGPRLASRFGLPYITAEASHAPKRSPGPWATWHAVNEAAIRGGTAHFCFTERDRAGLAPLVDNQTLLPLLPFIDAPRADVPPQRGEGPVELITVAMMREGAKARSYGFLAQALAALPDRCSWRLSVIGDGPARDAVRLLFADLPSERIDWRGELSGGAVAAALAQADLYVWPGFEEAYGMAYLEAGAAGLPSVAMRSGGIASVVLDGETGLLVEEGDLPAYTAALARLIDDHALRHRLGANARRFVREDRNLARAASTLSRGLDAALSFPRAPA